jgi:uncharacterized membrane protein YoaK (UPF0700 family)
VARIGDELSRGHYALAVHGLSLVAAFFVGAFTATALVLRTKRRRRGRYALALAAETMTLLAVALLGLFQWPRAEGWIRVSTTILLCFAMGAQNALVTKISGAVVRTTHLTGIVTDLGIEAVRMLNWLRASKKSWGLPDVGQGLIDIRRHPELKRLRLHSTIFVSFLSGAIVGPFLYVREGYTAMLLPIVVLTGLMIFDVAIGLGVVQPAGETPPRGTLL